MTKPRYTITNISVEEVYAVGGTDVKVTRHCNIIFANLSDDQVRQLEQKGATVIEQVRVEAATISIPKGEDVTPPVPIEAVPVYHPAQVLEGLGFEEARKLTDPPLSGAGINIAVVDSGIQKTHSAIGADRIIFERDYTVLKPGDPYDEDEMDSGNPSDVFDHGTGVAHIILTAAPNSRILNLKVLDSRGTGTPEHLIYAIDRCMTMHDERDERAPSIINLSLGIKYEDTIGPEDPVRTMCQRARIEYGIWVIAAAGNEGKSDDPYKGTIMVPAVEQYVLAVGSCRFNPFAVSDFSSRGPCPDYNITKPDVSFPGENHWVASSKWGTEYTPKSGTSYSTPFITGICALYHEAVIILETAKDPKYLFGPMELIMDLVRIEKFIDSDLIRLCILPDDDEYKSNGNEKVPPYNDLGYGVPYGPLFLQELMPRRPFDITGIMSMVLIFGMLGAVMRST